MISHPSAFREAATAAPTTGCSQRNERQGNQKREANSTADPSLAKNADVVPQECFRALIRDRDNLSHHKPICSGVTKAN
jgi:hypothetical protein